MQKNTQKTLRDLAGIFFLSGFCALIYQVSWQRLLFTHIGVDLTSITVIISVFMAGLGVGAYFGGRLADRFSDRIILIFCLIELGIGLFGLASYHILLQLGQILSQAGWVTVALGSFVILLLPTFMMGATLPLLTFFFNQRIGNIGQAIGGLYFCNTLGAAMGAIGSAFALYNRFTLSQTIAIAACLNIAIAATVYTLYRQHEKQASALPSPEKENKSDTKNTTQPNLIYLLSFASGFLSLGIEVIWVRIVSFAAHSVPHAFSYTLALFLLGIALGAHGGKRLCQKYALNTQSVGRYFLLAFIVDIAVIGVAYTLMRSEHFIYWAAILIVASASVRGLIFPMVHHIGTTQSKSGKQISNVYFANVLGSALSPILIGFVALDYASTQQIYLIICLLTLATYFATQRPTFKTSLAYSGLLAIFALALWLPEKIFHRLSEQNGMPLSELIENKHGFIQVYQDGKDSVVYGANVYDGKFNTDLFYKGNNPNRELSTNVIERAYVLPALNGNLKNILIIGLSTGSWARVLTSVPEASQITIVEINPDYVGLIKKHPEVAPLLDDPRVHIVVDDGRKWIRQHQDRRFDLILMNITWHWRAYASNLLSQDFLNLVKPLLSENGLLAYNTTGSTYAYITAARVFDNVYQYHNFVIVGKKPINHKIDHLNAEYSQNLARLRWQNGEPVFAGDNLGAQWRNCNALI